MADAWTLTESKGLFLKKESDLSKDERRPQKLFFEDARMKQAMESLESHPHIQRLLNQLWTKDPDTYRHCHRVADFSQAIGAELGLGAQERVEIYLTGLLHDIGKLLTPDSVLKKPGPLTQDEFAIMRLHPEDSGKIVSTVLDISYLSDSIRGHHERIDGRGYPDNLKGDSIPLFSRIVLVADTFDAMTNNRVYRKQIDLGRTYEELKRCSGTQFDPSAAQAFIDLHERFVQVPEVKKAA
jgi:HD-GYP domain-containing protein (c-di-GMP phosphodiesterase class II)